MQENERKKSLIKHNILLYLDNKGITKYKFYKETGIARGVLDQDTGMSEENTARFISYYSDVNPIWLLTGNGRMLKDGYTIDTEINTACDSVPEYKKRTEGIPLIPINAMAGYMKGEIQVLEYECERYVVPAFKEADFLIRVKGDSMYPKYSSGDIVACKKLLLNDLFFQWNKVYVVDTTQGALIKRIKKGSDNEHITICSDNMSYEPFELHRGQINSIALVVGVIRLE